MKLLLEWVVMRVNLSPPTRGRGLKRHAEYNVPSSVVVAPYAGAWIETIHILATRSPHTPSPPTRGRGLKRPKRR